MMDTGIIQKMLKDSYRAGKVPQQERLKDLDPFSILRCAKSESGVTFKDFVNRDAQNIF